MSGLRPIQPKITVMLVADTQLNGRLQEAARTGLEAGPLRQRAGVRTVLHGQIL